MSLVQARCGELYSELETIEKEVKAFYETIHPYERNDLNNCSHSLDGYVMVCFSKIDLFSTFKYGDSSTNGKSCRVGQTERMINYMLDYGITSDREAANVAVQLWRHKLMHTSQPRVVKDRKTTITYSWLSQWTENQLKRSDHFTFTESSDRILRLCLACLVADLKSSFKRYEQDLTKIGGLQSNFRTIEKENALPQEFDMK